ncbi:hypothetical protein SAMN05443377_1391 [Propionibacterium cyclohexanicum]|uniref:Uncharacterized protein n=1 Tax=Propionibacterium cyclohexanicum TaxID=64702 RepID=A0A1H9U4M9_9ACTN|nr:hypothetical protein SAMN05443377_1391 [Propionibacterium cyclohexanicum]
MIVGAPDGAGLTPAFAGKTGAPSSSRRCRRAHPRIRGEDAGPQTPPRFHRGSPPHSRGRLPNPADQHASSGLTPAFAGKTGGPRRCIAATPAHPRIRGEDAGAGAGLSRVMGSPPHSRGRPYAGVVEAGVEGLTPAFAGKTRSPQRWGDDERAHPRIRGEDQGGDGAGRAPRGSPPHSRGRQHVRCFVFSDGGLTPAFAGKTSTMRPRPGRTGAHPRIRGEDWQWRVMLTSWLGSPPHSRGRLTIRATTRASAGLTPAFAGKTATSRPARRRMTAHPRIRGEDPDRRSGARVGHGSPPHSRGRLSEQAPCASRSRAHPRIRGEDLASIFLPRLISGSPPHSRGRRGFGLLRLLRIGLTPAFAGKTYPARYCHPGRRAHPRIRGEDGVLCCFCLLGLGSPPHSRGRPDHIEAGQTITRLTPAFAGKTRTTESGHHREKAHPRIRGEDSRGSSQMRV